MAVVWRRNRVVASFQAKLVSTNESVPVEHLRECMAIRIGSSIGENNTSKRVALEIGTVWVKFTAFIRGVQSNARVLDEADNLNVTRSFGPLQSGDSTWRDEAGTVVGLGAVGYDLGLNIANKASRIRGAPQAEVIRSVED